MKFAPIDLVITIVAIGVVTPMIAPMFRPHCMQGPALEIYQDIVIAAIAILSAYAGSKAKNS